MFDIREEDKDILCIYIEYYRKLNELSSARYKISNFVLDDNDFIICTPSYYSRIQNKKLIALDDMYHSLLKNLKTKYSFEPELNEIILKLNIQLLNNAEYNRTEQIHSTLTKAMRILETMDNIIIYREIKEMYLLIHDYYINSEFHEDLIDKYIDLIQVVPIELKPIIISIAYQYYTRVKVNFQNSLNIIRLSEEFDSSRVIHRYLKIVYLLRLEKYKDSYEECKRLEIMYNTKKNTYYLSKTYNILSLLSGDANQIKSIEYLEKAISCHKEGLNNHDIKAYKVNLSILFFNVNNYKECIKRSEEAIELYDSSINVLFPYYISSSIMCDATKETMDNAIITLQNNIGNASIYYQTLAELFISIIQTPEYENTLPKLEYIIKHYKKELLLNTNYIKALQLSLLSIATLPNNGKLYTLFIENFT